MKRLDLPLTSFVALSVLVLCTKTVDAQLDGPCSIVVPGQVFCDDFSNPNLSARDRDPVRWVPDRGRISIEDESLKIEDSSTFSRATPAGVSLDNVSVRTRTRTTEAGPFLQVRFSPGVGGDTGYFAGLSADGIAYIAFSGDNARTIEDNSDIDLDPMQEDVLMQFDAIGDELSLYLWGPNESFPVGKPAVRVIDDTIPGPGQIRVGLIPLSSQLHSGSFSYVQVASQSIPEPSSAILCLCGLLGLLPLRRRRS